MNIKNVVLQEGEQIKDIPNYQGKYYVTSTGRIYSNLSHKWLKPTQNKRKGSPKSTRLYVNLGRGGQNRHYVHRLVASAFLPNPENKPEVDHIDTNPLNNNVNNLRWTTRQENLQNKNTLNNLKNNTGYYIKIRNIQTGEVYIGYKDAAEKCNVSVSTINNHVNNKVKHPKWEKLSDQARIRPENSEK